MTYYDFHTHRRETAGDVAAIVNVKAGEAWTDLRRVSVGVHPWHVTAQWREQVEQVSSVARRPEVACIGECGLDRLRGGVWEWQRPCFEAQLVLAREVGKPVVVHCVRAIDEVVAMRKKFGDVAMVLHGFRGKPQQAAQLLGQGFWLSFGPLFNAESLRMAFEAGRMCLETDDSGLSIREVYERASSALSISPTDIPVPGTFWR